MLLYDDAKPPRDCVVCRQVAPDRMELTSYDLAGRPTEGFWSDAENIHPSCAELLVDHLRARKSA